MEDDWYNYPKSKMGPGVPLTSDNVRKERLDICSKCEFLDISKYCKVCGCFLPAKTYFKNFSCPIEKWFEENE
jgi:hypothetical protein